MKAKIIVLLLVLSAVLLSGCVGDEQPVEEPEEVPEEEVAPEEEVPEEEVPEEEVTPEENETAEEEMAPEEEVTPEENETAEEEEEEEEEEVAPEGPVVVSPEIREDPYVIRIDNFRAFPASLTIKKGETVAWINFQDRLFTLVSEEGLFENTNLVYKRSFAYTFEETGTYNFSVLGQPRMDVTITVEEP